MGIEKYYPLSTIIKYSCILGPRVLQSLDVSRTFFHLNQAATTIKDIFGSVRLTETELVIGGLE